MSFLPAIQPHTTAKHHILKYYLEQWFPILGRRHRSLRYIDGFAGPGNYEGGELGSPFIALNAIRGHWQFQEFSRLGKHVEFLFVEKEPDHYENLKAKVCEVSWPASIKTDVKLGEFEHIMSRHLDDMRNSDLRSPTLAFIDPFGPAGFPMELLGRLASFDRMEVLVNLNYNEFVQWILPDKSKHITADKLYGGTRWRPALEMAGSDLSAFLVEEYEAALNEIGWRGTSFEMVNSQNQIAYNLVFGTRSSKGLEAMKRAMRTASPTGEFRYTDRLDPRQPIIPGMDISFEHAEEIGEHLFQKYEGKEVAFDYLMAEEIDWHRWWLDQDLRRGLIHLEYGDNQRISDVRNGDGRVRRKHSYPDGCFVTFNRPLQPKLM